MHSLLEILDIINNKTAENSKDLTMNLRENNTPKTEEDQYYLPINYDSDCVHQYDFESTVVKFQRALNSVPEPFQNLSMVDNHLIRFSSVELKTLFSQLPETLVFLDISDNALCSECNPKESWFRFGQTQENKLAAICKTKAVRNIAALGMAGNAIHRLSVNALKDLGTLGNLKYIALDYNEIIAMTHPQISALITLFPRLETVVFVDARRQKVSIEAIRRHEQINYFLHQMPCYPAESMYENPMRSNETSK